MASRIRRFRDLPVLKLRKWHRLLSVVSAVFLLSLGISGLVLQFRQVKYRWQYPQEAPTGPETSVPVQEIPLHLYSRLPELKGKIAAEIPHGKVERAVLLLRGDRPSWNIYVQTGPKRNDTRLVSFDAETLAITRNEAFSYDSFWISLHTGQFFGDSGLIVNFLAAVVFLLVIASGAALFFRP